MGVGFAEWFEMTYISILRPLTISLVGVAISFLLYGETLSWLSVLLVAFFVFCVLAFLNFEVLHPAVWFLPFLFLYHFSIFFLSLIGARNLISPEETLWASWLALYIGGVVFSCFSPVKVTNSISFLHLSYYSILLLYVFFAFLVVAINYIFHVYGLESKAEVRGSGLNKFYPVITWFLFFSCCMVFLWHSGYVKHIFGWLSLLSFVIFFATAINLGERNFFFAFLVFFFMSAFSMGKIGKKKLLLISLVLLALIPILGGFKNAFSGGGSWSGGFSKLLFDLINGEFRSAGYNLDYVIGYKAEWDLFYGKTFFVDFVKSIVPNSIFSLEGAIGWYNKKFHPDVFYAGRGYGFSILAEGYINFGLWGVALVSVVLTLGISIFYKAARNNGVVLFCYVFCIPIFIYSIRADASNIISPIIKSLLIPGVVLWLFYVLARKSELKHEVLVSD